MDQFTCDICGKQFAPDPDCMVEGFIAAGNDESENWKGECGCDLFPEDREEVKAELGVTDAELDQLLKGAVVETAMCVCKACQDEMHEEQYGWVP